MSYIAEVSRLYVLLTLLFSALGKSLALRQFGEDLSDSFRVPQRVRSGAALTIVGAEWLIAALLSAGGSWTLYGLTAALILFLIFIVAMATALRRGEPIYCNCFGRSSHPLSRYDLLRNAILIGATGISFLYHSGETVLNLLSYILLIGIAYITYLISTNLHEIAALAGVRIRRWNSG